MEAMATGMDRLIVASVFKFGNMVFSISFEADFFNMLSFHSLAMN